MLNSSSNPCENKHVIIEEPNILPTEKQGLTCIDVCQMLSNYYKDIVLFRFNAITGEIFILAGENMQIIINRPGNWEFINEA
jgi:hypothetical protein